MKNIVNMSSRLLPVFLVTFATMYACDFITHGLLMSHQYKKTPHLWRPHHEMMTMMPHMIVNQLFMSLVVTLLLDMFVLDTTVRKTLIFSGLLASLNAAGQWTMHIVSPYPRQMVVSWIIENYVAFMLIGVASFYVTKWIDSKKSIIQINKGVAQRNMNRTGENLKENLTRGVDNLKDNVNRATDNLKDNLHRAGDAIRDNVKAGSDFVNRMGNDVRERMDNTRDRIDNSFHGANNNNNFNRMDHKIVS